MSDTPTFYLLYGDDSLSIDEAVAKMRASMKDQPNGELNTTDLDGEQVSIGEVVSAVSAFPFLCDRRLVLVRGLVSHITRKGAGETGKKAMEQLLEALPDLPDHARLVLMEHDNLRSDSKIVKLANSHDRGYSKHFSKPKDPTNWIVSRAREYGAEIELRAAHALAEVTGGDLRRADNELIKLVSYVDAGQAIAERDVAVLTPYVPEASIFNMVDAIARGQGKIALKLMHQILDADPRDPGFGLFGMIVRQFRLLLLAREHLAMGGSPASVRETIGVRTAFEADKFSRLSRSFTVEQLDHIYRRLQAYDVQMKTGRIEPRLALDIFVVSVAQ